MDVVTQGFLGAALAQAGSKQAETRLATGIGFAAGLLADADALIYSAQDSLLTIEYHRHFTHSLFFIPVGALIAALILWPFLRRRIGFGRLYLFSLLGYSLSGFIDACTSYGTHLLWPFSDRREAFHLVAIVDPVFTLGLASAVVIAWRKRLASAARFGLLFAACYLLVAFVQLQRAESAAEQLAIERGHQPQRLIAKPTFGNILLWRSIYEHDKRFYVDAVRVGSEVKIYPGESIARFDAARDWQAARDTVLYRDVVRFDNFSDSYVAWHPVEPNVLADIRYSIQPEGIDPLWGIAFDPAQPDQHVTFTTYRHLNQRNRQRFLVMLTGGELAE